MFPALDPSVSRTAPQQRIAAIYQAIRNRICTNRYPPETVLREEALAREYAVSRSPIRRVLSMLEHEGLVEIKHGVGTIVTRIEPERLEEVYAVRQILAEASGPFIRMPMPEGAHEFFLERGREFLALDRGDAIGFAEVNIRYMLGLTDMVGNTTLREQQRNLFFQTSRMWLLLLPELSWEETLAAVHEETAEVARRVELSDPIGLSYVMRNHIHDSRVLMFSGLRGR